MECQSTFFGKTDIGKKRNNNQDCFKIENLSESMVLLTLCDGMGGANGGSVASSLCAEEFCAYVKENINILDKSTYLEVLERALEVSNEKVYLRANENKALEGMGTTIVCALYDGEKYYLLWVGDSRIYALTGGKLVQLSHDHSFVQTLVDNGSISSEEAKNHPNRNIITRAVGTEESIECDMSMLDKENIDVLLLCSDGLSSYTGEELIEHILNKRTDVKECCEQLINAANNAGGHDNITVILHTK